jgi:hypothetical protein
MKLTVGLLYSTHTLLDLVADCATTTEELLTSFKRIEVANSEDVIVISQACSWIELGPVGNIRLTELGEKIRSSKSSAERLRTQLRDIVRFHSFSWTKRLASGRGEALKTLPSEVEQIFSEAGLLEEWDDDLLRYWDGLGLSVRVQRQEINFRTGREAERLTFEQEAKRTKRCPDWKARDTTFAGYDILSVVDEKDHSSLPIEVKGTVQSPREAFFFVSRHEWDTAETSANYCFYLWTIRDKAEFRVVPSSEMQKHIAQDRGSGMWDQVKIPYKPFW